MKNTTRFLLGATSFALLATLGFGTKASADTAEIDFTYTEAAACAFDVAPVDGTWAFNAGEFTTATTGSVNFSCNTLAGSDITISGVTFNFLSANGIADPTVYTATATNSKDATSLTNTNGTPGGTLNVQLDDESVALTVGLDATTLALIPAGDYLGTVTLTSTP